MRYSNSHSYLFAHISHIGVSSWPHSDTSCHRLLPPSPTEIWFIPVPIKNKERICLFCECIRFFCLFQKSANLSFNLGMSCVCVCLGITCECECFFIIPSNNIMYLLYSNIYIYVYIIIVIVNYHYHCVLCAHIQISKYIGSTISLSYMWYN